MGTFIIYIVESAVCLIIFYIFYKLLLSKDTFHKFNRIGLLCLLILSLALPAAKTGISLSSGLQNENRFVLSQDLQKETTAEQNISSAVTPEISYLNETGQVNAETEQVNAETKAVETSSENVVSQVENVSENNNTSSWFVLILVSIYLTGIVSYLVFQMISMIKMFRLMRLSRTAFSCNEYKILAHDKDIAPFSWMNRIVISEKDLEENGKEIITHELAHINKKHSLDLLIADICISFQWFNPAAWLLKQELQSIHEFEADDMVINQGIDAKKYQLLLIKKAVGTRLYSMANSFNHSSLKKRITMMLKKKSNPWARLKYLYILPLSLLTMVAFARPDVSRLEKLSAEKVNNLVSLSKVETQSVDKINENDANLSSFGSKKSDNQASGLLLAADVKKTTKATPPPPPVKSKFTVITVTDKDIKKMGKTPPPPAKGTIRFTEPDTKKNNGTPLPPPLKSTVRITDKDITIMYTDPDMKEVKDLPVKGVIKSATDKRHLSAVSITEIDSVNRVLSATQTDDNGKFEFTVKSSRNRIRLSHVGFKTVTMPVHKDINYELDEATLNLEGLVVVGYGASNNNNTNIEIKDKNTVYTMVEQMPSYPGGETELMKYILGNLRYPVAAKNNKIEGKVVCSCVINENGKVTDVKVEKSVDPDLDYEAKRVIENMPNWVPGKQNGKACRVKYSLPITYRLAK